MIVYDLNYLENTSEEVLGGYSAPFLNINETVNVSKSVNVNLNIKGNLAGATAGADAYGSNTLAETATSTYTTNGYSGAGSSSLSGTK